MTDGSDPADDPLDGTVAWRELLTETTERLAAAGIEGAGPEARWIIEAATGRTGADLVLGLDDLATVRGVAHLDAMVARRLAGEPIQHVVGSWGFRTLDLLCDGRALIPRPETEQVVGVALEVLDRVLLGRPTGHRALVVDLGTGTGAIALSVAVERPGTDVWATDASTEALAVARANLAALGMAGTHVRLAQGSWWAALPAELAGTIDLVVSNPPYIGVDEELDASVRDWEPAEALFAGTDGLDAYRAILADAARWLAPGGAVVLELGATQAAAVGELARAGGLDAIEVHPDHAGHDRALVALNPR